MGENPITPHFGERPMVCSIEEQMEYAGMTLGSPSNIA